MLPTGHGTKLWKVNNFIFQIPRVTSLIGSFEKLNSNHSEHELEEDCDHHDVLDGGHRHDDRLDDSLQSLGSLNCSKRSEDTTDAQNLQDGHCSSAGEVVKDMDK